MKLTLAPQRHPGLVPDNRTHFLLSGASVEAKVGFDDGSFRTFQGVPGPGPGTLVVEVEPGDFPPGAAPTQVDLDYTVSPTLGGRTFTALRITQRLLVTALPGLDPPGHRFAPGGWHDALGRLRVSNRLTHPLADLGGLAQGRVELNTLVLDLTDGWSALHAGNPVYALYDDVMKDGQLTARVFAHTAGTPLIWHAVVPRHLVAGRAVSPHIFLQPSDNREGQNRADDEAYLTRNAEHFRRDGTTLMKYLLPPVPDDEVERRRRVFASAADWRNVVRIARIAAGPRKGQVTPLHWSLPAGLQRAFEHRGEGRPAQLLLVPQRVGSATSAASGSYGAAVTRHVLRAVDAVLALVQTNTTLTLTGGDTLLERGKLVYSGYSEAGFDLWNVGRLLGDHLKAVVAIEPQNLNRIQNDYRPTVEEQRVGDPPSVGKDVIPLLLKKGVHVFIIGRHHLHYRPEVPGAGDLLRLLPAAPAAAFAYPPDPAANGFVEYRVQRLVEPGLDPLMTDEERDLLKDLSTPGLPPHGLLAKVFRPEANEDRSVADGLQRWYSHQFALSGGDELTVDPAAVYGTPVAYRTWFQVAVHEIG